MIVECPSCTTIFPVDPKKVPPGGIHARCSVCSEVFLVRVPDAKPEAPEETAPEAVPGASEAGAAVEAESVPEVEAEPVAEVEATPEPEVEATPEPEVEAEPVAEASGEVTTPGFEEPEVTFQGPDAGEEPAPWETEAEEEPEEPEEEPAPTFEGAEATFQRADDSSWADDVAGEEPPVGDVPAEEPPVEEPPVEEPAEEEAPAPEAETPKVPEAGQAPDALPEPESPPVSPPTFGKRDPMEKAQRLARVLVSDIILYNPDRHHSAAESRRIKEEFEEEIQKSWNEYVEQVGEDVANSTPFFNDALNEILAKGEKIF